MDEPAPDLRSHFRDKGCDPPSSDFGAASKVGDEGWRKRVICLALGLITLALYLPAVRHEFLGFDDQQYVTENSHVQAGLTRKSVAWAFGSHAGNWHPLAWISHELDCQIYGLRPAGHHLTNVLLHTANTLLLFVVLRRMTGAAWRSAAVAALFGWHPLHVESVAWVAERKDVLSAFFWMLTLWAYVRYAESHSPSPQPSPQGEGEASPVIFARSTLHAPRFYILSLSFFVLGLMSKPMVVTLPFVLLLLDYWPLRRSAECGVRSAELGKESRSSLGSWGRLVLEKVPFFALAAVACKLTLWAQTDAIVSTKGLPVFQRVVHALVAYAHYLGATFVPIRLAVYYPYEKAIPAGQIILAGVVLAIISLVTLLLAKRRPWLVVGWFWFLGTLVPVIGLVQVGDQAWADRYTYLPLIGVFVMIIWTAVEALKGWATRIERGTIRSRKEGHTSLARRISLTLIASPARTFSWVWKRRHRENRFNGFPPAVETVETVPSRPDLRSTQLKQGVNENGIKGVTISCERCVAGTLVGAIGVAMLAATSVQLSYWKDTRTLFEHAAKVTHNNYMAVTLLGSLLAKEGKFEEAAKYYRTALSYQPGYPEAHFFLGHALDQQGKLEDAIAEYKQALWFKPSQEQTHIFLGVALAKQKKYDEAAAHYFAALKLNPESAVTHNNLAKLLHTQGRLDEAIEHYSAALKLDPDLAQAHNNLGILFAQQGRAADGAAQLREALRLNPGNAESQYNLGLALNQLGRWDEAAELFAKTVAVGTQDPNAHYQFGLALGHLGKTKEAMSQYASALLLHADFPEALDGLSWILATAASSGFRNGTEAVRMAERACELTGRKDVEKLKTLAAAYAEAGRFPEAISTARAASELAARAGRKELAEVCGRMGESFRAGKAWRE